MRIELGFERSHLMRIHFDAHPMRIEGPFTLVALGSELDANGIRFGAFTPNEHFTLMRIQCALSQSTSRIGLEPHWKRIARYYS